MDGGGEVRRRCPDRLLGARSHAHYFGPGIFKTEALWDIADGKGHSARQTLVYLDEDPPGWRGWPGSWGGTTPEIADIESSSPVGLAQHHQWHQPASLAQGAKPAYPVTPLETHKIRVRRALSS